MSLERQLPRTSTLAVCAYNTDLLSLKAVKCYLGNINSGQSLNDMVFMQPGKMKAKGHTPEYKNWNSDSQLIVS